MDIELFFLTVIVLLILFSGLAVFFFKARKKIAGVIFSFCFWLVFSSGGIILHYAFISGTKSNGNKSSVTVKIRKGLNARRISELLRNRGIISSEKEFMVTSFVFGFNRKMQAGKFRLSSGQSNYSVLEVLSSGKAEEERLTIPEGLTYDRICSIFVDSLEIDSLQFITYVTDKKFVHSTGVKADNLEGYLFPETYYFPWGISEKEIISTMVTQFREVFNDTLQERARQLGFTVHEIVTLASIIEGEAMLDEERDEISAVFHNRLKKRMRLQADPAIQYIIKDGPRRLLLEDLKIESPYNTYLHRGLPPGPICSPGRKSIYAALYPSDDDYLYFVADGDGTHIFSTTQAEHLKAKRTLDKLRRELRNKRK